jgi:hypothetical protein
MMNPAIEKGLIPPAPGLEKEEPELAHEDDIPADDGTVDAPGASGEGLAPVEERPLRHVERE